MSAQAASSSNVSEACAKAAELSSRGTAALHRLMNTVSSLLAVGSGSGERPALGARIDPELLKLSVAERTTKLYGDYVQCSRELQEVVTECAAHGPVLNAAVAAAKAAKQEGTESDEQAALRARAEALRERVRERNGAVKEVMDHLAQLLNDMTMWECCARAAKEPAP
eukprot:jgi/Tetstr1/453356/TSEL_040347.t1